MKTTFRHRDPRFVVTIAHSYWGGRRSVTATFYLDDWGLFYRATRDSAKKAYRAADHAIREYNARGDFAKYTAMKVAGV